MKCRRLETFQTLSRVEAKRPELLFNILLMLTMIGSVAVAELPAFMPYPNYTIYNDGLFIALAILLSFLGGALILVGFKRYQVKLNPVILGIFGLLSLFTVIGTFATPTSVEIPYGDHQIFEFSLADKFRYAFGSLFGFFGLWCLFTFGPVAKNRRGAWFLFCEGLILFAFAAILYSFITEGDVYRAIFSGQGLSGDTAPVSYAGQKNAFGRYILVGILAELYLLYLDRRYIRYVVIAFLSFCLCLTMAKTPLIFAAIAIWGTLVYLGILNLKKHRIIAIIHFGIAGLSAIIALLLFLLPTSALGPLGSIIASIKGNAEIGGGGTIDTRVVIWDKCLQVWGLSGASRAFGFGDYAYVTLINPAMDIIGFGASSHNAYVEALGRGGVTRLILESLLTLYILYRLFLCLKAKRKDAILLGLFLILFLLHGILESNGVIDFSCESVSLIGLIVIPLLSNDADEVFAFKGSEVKKKEFGKALFRFALLLAPTLIVGLAVSSLAGLIIAIFHALGILVLAFFFVEKEHRVYYFSALGLSILAAFLLGTLFPFQGVFDVLGLMICVGGISTLPLVVLSLYWPELGLGKAFHPMENVALSFLAYQELGADL